MKKKMTRTPVITQTDVSRSWYVLDASTAPIGRIATRAASLLIGKHKPTVTSHIDNGEFVIIVNADKAVVTGKKDQQAIKYRHSGYPGNLHEKTLGVQRQQTPAKVFEEAVYGMIPKNKLRTGRMERLKIYAGAEHPHEAQKPVKMEIK